MTDIKEQNQDGKYIEYLNLDEDRPHPKLEKEFKSCDPELYQLLQKIVKEGKRTVAEVQKLGILGQKTKYYDVLLGSKERSVWHLEGFTALKSADVVFFDPDNGLEVASCPKTRKKNVKYIYYDELADYYNRGQSLIVYQHRDHKPNEEYKKRFHRIHECEKFKKPIGEMFLLRFTPYSVRDYLFVLQSNHAEDIQQNLFDLIDGEWGRMFYLIEL